MLTKNLQKQLWALTRHLFVFLADGASHPQTPGAAKELCSDAGSGLTKHSIYYCTGYQQRRHFRED